MNLYMGSALSVFVLMNIMFLLALKLKRNDLADVIWGPGFIVLAFGAGLTKYFSVDGLQLNLNGLLVVGAVTLWAIRLFWHLGWRTLKKSSEDARYQKMRDDWKEKWVLNTYLYVFMLQGFLMYWIGLPIMSALDSNGISPVPLLYLGALVWILGFIFETVSDHQLKNFKANPENKGRIMTEGLWSWSRHPNYFGEVVQWWGIAMMSFQMTNWFIFISPILITFLILKVSGVPLLEKLMEGRPGFEEYKRKTSRFIPLPPRQ